MRRHWSFLTSFLYYLPFLIFASRFVTYSYKIHESGFVLAWKLYTIQSISEGGRGWCGSSPKVNVTKRTNVFVFLRSSSILLLIPKECYHLTFLYKVFCSVYFWCDQMKAFWILKRNSLYVNTQPAYNLTASNLASNAVFLVLTSRMWIKIFDERATVFVKVFSKAHLRWFRQAHQLMASLSFLLPVSLTAFLPISLSVKSSSRRGKGHKWKWDPLISNIHNEINHIINLYTAWPFFWIIFY